jgi:O-antigen/teichoic acid export membrane protein
MKKNIVANYLGRGWQVLMGVAFIPIYIRHLGVEAYGLIGIFALLQTWLRLLDMGMIPALGREMARFVGGAHDAQSIRDLLRSIEIVVVAVAVLVGLGIWAASGWLASDWLTAQKLPTETIARAFSIMGAVTALRFIQDIYTGSISGLQRQVLQNVIISTMATIRGVGAIGVLAWVSPTIDAFFIWQGLVSVLTLAVFCTAVYRTLPPCPRPAQFNYASLAAIWHFAAGIVALTFLGLLLTQIDKILLSRLLTLEAFGYYVLAGFLANSVYMLQGPIVAAVYPRFTELVAKHDNAGLRAIYHQSSQAVTIVIGAAAVMLIVFGREALMVWTGNAELTQRVAPIMSLLAAGTLLNGFTGIPYVVQLAHAWTKLQIITDIVAVCILVPAIFWAVPLYGAMGAAWIWLILNIGYLFISVSFMYRRILTAEKWRWYLVDLAVPLAAAAAAVLICHLLTPNSPGRIAEFGVLIVSFACALVAATLAAPAVRIWTIGYLRGKLKRISTLPA